MLQPIYRAFMAYFSRKMQTPASQTSCAITPLTCVPSKLDLPFSRNTPRTLNCDDDFHIQLRPLDIHSRNQLPSSVISKKSMFTKLSDNFDPSQQLEFSMDYFWTTIGNLQLDIVGFLATLGEGSVVANAQVAALTRLICLPRLIPAPQALMQPSKPQQLRPEPGVVAGVYSGNLRLHVNHIARILM